MAPSKIHSYKVLEPNMYRNMRHQLKGSVKEKGYVPFAEVGLVKIVSSFRAGINFDRRKTATVMHEKIRKTKGSNVIFILLLDAILFYRLINREISIENYKKLWYTTTNNII